MSDDPSSTSTAEKNVPEKKRATLQIFFNGPLDAEARRDRNTLLIAATIGLAIGFGNLIPSSFSALGVQISEIHPRGLSMILAAVVAYLTLSFVGVGWRQWQSWEWQLLDQRRVNSAYSPVRSAPYPTLMSAMKQDEWRNYGDILGTLVQNRVTISLAVFELLLPIVVGGYSGFVLWNWNADTKPPQMVSILSQKSASNEPRSTVVALRSQFAVVLGGGDSDGIATFVVPFAEEAVCAGKERLNWVGVGVANPHREMLEGLARDLSACGSLDQPVEIEVFGFASSSTVKNRPEDCNGVDSEEKANLEIALSRRDNVVRVLEQSAKPGLVKITAHKWQDPDGKPSPSMMEKGRRFNDVKLSGVYDPQKGQLNRRVEVRLLKAPLCEIAGQPPSP